MGRCHMQHSVRGCAMLRSTRRHKGITWTRSKPPHVRRRHQQAGNQVHINLNTYVYGDARVRGRRLLPLGDAARSATCRLVWRRSCSESSSCRRVGPHGRRHARQAAQGFAGVCHRWARHGRRRRCRPPGRVGPDASVTAPPASALFAGWRSLNEPEPIGQGTGPPDQRCASCGDARCGHRRRGHRPRAVARRTPMLGVRLGGAPPEGGCAAPGPEAHQRPDERSPRLRGLTPSSAEFVQLVDAPASND
jgi:hypothetical protein